MKTIFQSLLFLDPVNQSNFPLHLMYMVHGAGKTTKCLRALASFGEGLGSVPSVHIGWQWPATPTHGIWCPLLASMDPPAYIWYT